jgi:hypothetical protein
MPPANLWKLRVWTQHIYTTLPTVRNASCKLTWKMRVWTHYFRTILPANRIASCKLKETTANADQHVHTTLPTQTGLPPANMGTGRTQHLHTTLPANTQDCFLQTYMETLSEDTPTPSHRPDSRQDCSSKLSRKCECGSNTTMPTDRIDSCKHMETLSKYPT